MDLGEGDTEFLHLEYAGGAKLYVPVAQLHVISRYSGADPEAIELHTLGSGQWEKAKKKAAEQVRDTAAELLHLYAQRAAREGHRSTSSSTTWKPSPTASASRKRPTSRPPSMRWSRT
jgi:transcription-repair coupling factor (superfamily II helicase)